MEVQSNPDIQPVQRICGSVKSKSKRKIATIRSQLRQGLAVFEICITCSRRNPTQCSLHVTPTLNTVGADKRWHRLYLTQNKIRHTNKARLPSHQPCRSYRNILSRCIMWKSQDWEKVHTTALPSGWSNSVHLKPGKMRLNMYS